MSDSIQLTHCPASARRYLRTLMIHGARSTLHRVQRKRDRPSRWIVALKERRDANVAAVALANKNARVLWALLAHDEDYRAPTAP
jgi:transposase